MARHSRTEQAILGFLTWGPMSGYDIKKAIEASIGNFWSESFGQIYPVLKRLAAGGLTTTDEIRSDGGRPSQIYRLTEQGRAALSEWLQQPPVPEPPRNELLLKLFFGRTNPPNTNIRHVERYRAQAIERLESYDAIERDLRQQHRNQPDLPYWLMTLSYGKHVERALIAWCEDALTELSGLCVPPDGSDTTAQCSPHEPPTEDQGESL